MRLSVEEKIGPVALRFRPCVVAVPGEQETNHRSGNRQDDIGQKKTFSLHQRSVNSFASILLIIMPTTPRPIQCCEMR